MPKFDNPHRIIWISLFLGWSADQLFYGKAAGVSVLLFCGLVWSGLVSIAHLENKPIHPVSNWLLVPVLFCAVMIMLRDNPFLTGLNLATIAFFLALLARSYATGNGRQDSLLAYAAIPWQTLGGMITRPYPLVEENVDLKLVHAFSKKTVFPVFRGTVLAVPILAIFSLLLISADVVFANRLEQILSIDISWRVLEYPWRLILIVLGSWPLAGWLLYALRPAEKEEKGPLAKLLSLTHSFKPLNFGETAIILFLVNLLFALFVGIQFTYLFGGTENIHLAGFTYAEYARRGFFELVLVSILALSLTQGLHQFSRRTGRVRQLIFNILSTITTGLVVIMLFSAFKRLSLYEFAYGYTELRLYTHTAIVWLGLLLVWSIGVTWLEPRAFATGVVGVALGFVVSLNLLNPDAFIVQRNLERFGQNGQIDLEYLSRLSADAVPDLLQAARLPELQQHTGGECGAAALNSPDGRSTSTNTCVDPQDITRFETHLRERLTKMEENERLWAWPAFHWSRWKALGLLRLNYYR